MYKASAAAPSAADMGVFMMVLDMELDTSTATYILLRSRGITPLTHERIRFVALFLRLILHGAQRWIFTTQLFRDD